MNACFTPSAGWVDDPTHGADPELAARYLAEIAVQLRLANRATRENKAADSRRPLGRLLDASETSPGILYFNDQQRTSRRANGG